MGILLTHLNNLVSHQLDRSGIVVWFDPEQSYKGVISKLDTGDTTVLIAEDSLFAVKHQAEPLLETAKRPRLLVYVPLDQAKTENALIELEKAGTVLTPGHKSINQNTRLEVLARTVLKPLIPETVEDICGQVRNGSLTFDDIEKIAEKSGELSGVVKLIFDTADPTEVVLRFISDTGLDETITAKNATPELVFIMETAFGARLAKDQSLDTLRTHIIRHILINDFLNSIPEVPTQLSSVPRPEKQAQLDQISRTADAWRNNLKLGDSYTDHAWRVMGEHQLETIDIEPAKLIDLQTFPFADQVISDWVSSRIIAGDDDHVEDIIQKRRTGFWSISLPETGLRWDIIATAAHLCMRARTVQKQAQSCELRPSDLVNGYCKQRWFKLDTLHRELERQCDLDIDLTDDLSERLIAHARTVYTETSRKLAELFQDACEVTGFDFGNLPVQRQVFATQIEPHLKDGKTAYILVDALRYEMGLDLVTGLEDLFDVEVIPAVCTIPGVTMVGMAALLPQADKDFELADGKTIKVDGEKISSRKNRVDYLQEYLETGLVETKLNSLVNPRKSLRESIADTSFVLVTSQEIDEMAEQGNVLLARAAMSNILSQLRKVIVRLAQLGVQRFVITADHGHLFGDEIDSGDKVDAPGGKTLVLHRRVWLGQGGTKSKACVRVTAAKLGIIGDFELVFPRGIACFKTPGKDNPYYHGGLSLQELVIPVITLCQKETPQKVKEEMTYLLTMEKQSITTRFFSVQVSWKSGKQQQLIPSGQEHKRVHCVVRAGGKDVGMAVQAVYGFESGTRDILLEKDKHNHVTMMITEDVSQETVSVHLLDVETLTELARLDKVRLDISI